MTRKPQAPSYDRDHGDYARVVIDRRSIHLGKYDSTADDLVPFTAGSYADGTGPTSEV